MNRTPQLFTIEPADWAALAELSATAERTPVILVGGVNIAAQAHRCVDEEWDRLGRKYGFAPGTVQRHNERLRQIRAQRARPVTA